MTPSPGRTRHSITGQDAPVTPLPGSSGGQGDERTTIRAVAAVDPSMVMRLFGDKPPLFDATLTIGLRLPDLADVPADDLTQTLVRHFLERWEGDPAGGEIWTRTRSEDASPTSWCRCCSASARC
ncbi:hypothetical protein ACFVGX_29680 [Streptomyces sp. NPDC127113]|uniref:hypothetical protein n=2 Tax=unclassified Streptomyces TaxID=2593676 RepID=UPI0036257CBE